MPNPARNPEQPDLFAGLDEPGASASGVIAITPGMGGAPLNREQKRFNSLILRLQRARKTMDQIGANHDLFQRDWVPLIMEAEKLLFAELRKLVLTLHESPWRGKLSQKMRGRLATVLREALHRLLSTTLWEADKLLQELFQLYDPENLTFEEACKEEDALCFDFVADVATEFFGMDVTAEDLEDEERFRKKLEEAREPSAARGEKPRRERKKTAKQLDAERRREEAEKAIRKTTRQIYLDLVKNFHPDREPDEERRLEKTRQMQEITTAYESNDHLRLLQLQMTLLADRGNAFSGFEDQHLRHLNKALSDQLQQLEFDLKHRNFLASAGPLSHLIDADQGVMLHRVQGHLQNLEIQLREFQDNILQATASPRQYRALISELCEIIESCFENFDPPDPFERGVPF
jgi:hypothetical protein